MSKSTIKHASYSIHKILKQSKLSYASKASTEGILLASIKDLDNLGFHLNNISSIKQKHILTLVNLWKEKQLNNGTIKNRMAALRLACSLLNKHNVIKPNAHYEIGKRVYSPQLHIPARLDHEFLKHSITNSYHTRSPR